MWASILSAYYPLSLCVKYGFLGSVPVSANMESAVFTFSVSGIERLL